MSENIGGIGEEEARGDAPSDVVNHAEAALETAVLEQLSAFRGRIGGELGGLFDALAKRLRLFEGGPGAGYFSHPMALPVLQLPLWIAARYGDPGAPLIVRLAEAAAVGYLHVRIEDDWFDEAIGEPGASMLLSGALFARHQAPPCARGAARERLLGALRRGLVWLR